jgi:hypothetical protein
MMKKNMDRNQETEKTDLEKTCITFILKYFLQYAEWRCEMTVGFL